MQLPIGGPMLKYSSKSYQPISFVVGIGVFCFALQSMAFEIDFSRRHHGSSEVQTLKTNPSETVTPTARRELSDIFVPGEAKQELVILNTEKGFVPSRISLRKGIAYRIHVVNVNSKEKNISFILDAFSQAHSTYYGEMTTFEVKPAQEGVFTFQCPETSVEGKLAVISGETRGLATEE